jgi:cadmium resistance protein CadD (predicted permease)
VPEQTYRGTHRHRAPLGWHPPRIQEESNGDGGPHQNEPEPTAPFTPTFTGEMPVVADEASTTPAEQPSEPIDDQDVKRLTFVLVVAAVWLVAAAVGLGLFYWWFHTINKTPAVFIVLVYLVGCIVAALIAAMIQRKPVISALGIALMSAPFASTAAAAVLYGVYFCEHASRCLVGVIPY